MLHFNNGDCTEDVRMRLAVAKQNLNKFKSILYDTNIQIKVRWQRFIYQLPTRKSDKIRSGYRAKERQKRWVDNIKNILKSKHGFNEANVTHLDHS